MKVTCGNCNGDGWNYQYDGVGGRWEETCYQCKGQKTVTILDTPKQTQTNNLQWTRDQAIELCIALEVKLSPKYHVALAGSCLYRGESTKDVDIIVYPHGATNRDLVKNKLISLGWSMNKQGGMGLNRKYPGNNYIEIWTTGDNKRVDVFYLGETQQQSKPAELSPLDLIF